jgi:hypothetical protein
VLLFRRDPSRFLTARNFQRAFTTVALVTVLTVLTMFAMNYFLLQRPLSQVIQHDSRNHGVNAAVYFSSYVNTDVIVFDVRAISPPAGAPGVLRVFIQFAHEMQGRDVDEVIIAYRGQRRFKMMGDDFLGLGALVGSAQPKQLLWELAHNLRHLNNKLVISNMPGNYAALLQKSLGEGSEATAADQIVKTIAQ